MQAATDFRLDLPTSGSPYLALLTHVDLHDAAQAWLGKVLEALNADKAPDEALLSQLPNLL